LYELDIIKFKNIISSALIKKDFIRLLKFV